MRKSSIVVLVILLVGMVTLSLLYNYYMNQFIEEHRNAKQLTDEFAADLEPGTKIALGRVKGGARYVVDDPSLSGVVVFARPTEASWKAEPSGALFGRRVAIRLFEVYGDDRPATWVELRLTRPDGTVAPAFGYRRGEGRTIVPVTLPPR